MDLQALQEASIVFMIDFVNIQSSSQPKSVKSPLHVFPEMLIFKPFGLESTYFAKLD